MQPKLRASYTLLDMWAKGDWQGAINYYFKIKAFVTPAMVDGRNWHTKWEHEVEHTKALPAIFTPKKTFNNPLTEVKIEVDLAPWLQVVGKLDVLDAPTVVEFKTGKQDSEHYTSTYQLPFYAMICAYKGVYVDRGEIYHYDQYTKKVDMSIVWITDEQLANVKNWLETLGSEIHNYFVTNKLYERYGTYVREKDGVVRLQKVAGLDVNTEGAAIIGGVA